MDSELSASHADSAMVSYATASGNVVTISSFLPNGSMGEPSEKWNLLTVGNNEKVWQTQYSDAHQGYSGTRVQMIDASGKDMFENHAISFDELGACMDKKCERKATSIEGTFNLNAQGVIAFANADEVLASLQWGEHPEQGKLYEPKRAQMVFPLKGNNKTKFVAFIDIQERKLVYMDANFSADIRTATNNGTALQTKMPAFVEYLNTLPTVADMFKRNTVDSLPESFNDETSPTAILYSDENISLQEVNAYVFKPVNQKNNFTPITLTL